MHREVVLAGSLLCISVLIIRGLLQSDPAKERDPAAFSYFLLCPLSRLTSCDLEPTPNLWICPNQYETSTSTVEL